MSDPDSEKPAPIKLPRHSLLRLNARYPILTLAVVFVVGIVFWGSFNTAMEMTNSNAFCISCHEMEKNAYQDYMGTHHYKNPSGVRAGCPDCHVPRDWAHMLVRKIGASNELLHKLLGTIDTRKKYLKRRPKLAQKVWQSMKDTDSRECRNCHNLLYMDLEGQKNIASKAHGAAEEKGHTCIDCHKGVMHSLSEELRDAEHSQFEKEDVDCALCHAGMARAVDEEDWDWDDD